MKDPIEFYVQGIPKGQPRPKAFSRGGIAKVYDPGTAEGWKGLVALAAKGLLPAEPLAGCVYLSLKFYMPRPRGHYRTGKNAQMLKPSAPGFCSTKPDADNLAKAVMDALTQLNAWRDDAQVVQLHASKLYDNGGGPGCKITIAEA